MTNRYRSPKSSRGPWTAGGQERSRTPKESRPSPRSGVSVVRTLLYWLAFGVALLVAIANMVPYIKASEFVLVQLLGGGIWGFVVDRFLGFASLFVGAILWAFIQTAEAYPILLKHDRRLMRLIAMEADNADRLQIRDEDDPALARLKSWYNKFPLLSIRSANRVSLWAYCIDAAICISVFPPVDGNLGQLFFILVTGQWGQINWVSVALIVLMLFCFEAMVRLVLFLGMQAYYLRRAYS